MKSPRNVTLAVILVAAISGCASSSSTQGVGNGGAGGKLVVWDWKSGDKASEAYLTLAKARFAALHPNVSVEFVSKPFDQYYAWLDGAIKSGKGPDIAMFNGGGELRARTASLLPVDPHSIDASQRLTGWAAFTKSGTVYAAPVTLQGHPIYYNQALYRKAGLDPTHPPTTWDAFLHDCAVIKKVTSVSCFSAGNKEGNGIQFFMSGLGSGILTPQEYDNWIAGRRDWTSTHVKEIFRLWKQVNDQGLNLRNPSTVALFNDAFTDFRSGKAGNMIGLMSDVGHWKDFSASLGTQNVGVMISPVITPGARPSLPFDGGIGYGITTWSKDPKLATDLLASLVASEPLHAFFIDAGAIVSDTTIDTSAGGPAVAQLVGDLATGKPALHVALSAKTLDLMGSLSQQLLAGKVTVDAMVAQLAAIDTGK
jgi:multiple sugar transport system substrate-binding protein